MNTEQQLVDLQVRVANVVAKVGAIASNAAQRPNTEATQTDLAQIIGLTEAVVEMVQIQYEPTPNESSADTMILSAKDKLNKMVKGILS